MDNSVIAKSGWLYRRKCICGNPARDALPPPASSKDKKESDKDKSSANSQPRFGHTANGSTNQQPVHHVRQACNRDKGHSQTWERNWVELYRDGYLRYYESDTSPNAEDHIYMPVECLTIKSGYQIENVMPPAGKPYACLFAVVTNLPATMSATSGPSSSTSNSTSNSANTSSSSNSIINNKMWTFCAETMDQLRVWQLALEESRLVITSTTLSRLNSVNRLAASLSATGGWSPQAQMAAMMAAGIPYSTVSNMMNSYSYGASPYGSGMSPYGYPLPPPPTTPLAPLPPPSAPISTLATTPQLPVSNATTKESYTQLARPTPINPLTQNKKSTLNGSDGPVARNAISKPTITTSSTAATTSPMSYPYYHNLYSSSTSSSSTAPVLPPPLNTPSVPSSTLPPYPPIHSITHPPADMYAMAAAGGMGPLSMWSSPYMWQ